MAHRPDYESADYKEGYEDGKREASKQWVGLSDAELEQIVGEEIDVMYSGDYKTYRAVEAKLKEKNG